MSRRLFALVVILAVATAGRTEVSQQGVGGTPDTAIARMEAWVAAVAAHQPGEADEAARTVGAWSHLHLAEMVPYLDALLELAHEITKPDVRPSPNPRLVRPAPPGRRPPKLSSFEVERLRTLASFPWVRTDANRLLKRGALLHADIAMLVPPPAEVPPSDDRLRVLQLGRSVEERMAVRAPDADYRGVEYGSVHWDFARVLLAAVAPLPARDSFVRDWYRAVGAYFASLYLFAEAAPHFERAESIFSNDPYILFARGCLNESLASPGVQAFKETTILPGGLQIDVDSARTHLRRAESLFERAAALNHELIEARIRLARVRGLLGRPEQSATELRETLARTSDATLQYFGQMFLGVAETALGRGQHARRAFEAAARLFPRAQSPRLALGELARRAGDVEGASAVLLPHLGTTPVERSEEPWWDYYRGEGRYVDILLAELRRPYLEDRTP